MNDPFKPSAAVDLQQAKISLATTILLLSLAAMTAYLLVGDIKHLLAIQKGTLTRAGSVSLLHHIYLAVIPFEAAYFRILTSTSALIFIVFSLRNNQIFSDNALFLYLYGITQFIFHALAVTAILGILNQVSENKLFDPSYWSGVASTPSIISLLKMLTLQLLPPIILIIICYLAKIKIKSTTNPNSIAKNAKHTGDHIED